MNVRRLFGGAVASLSCLLSLACSGSGGVEDVGQVGTVAQAAPVRWSDTGPSPVLYDTDADFDDTAALAYLVAQHKLGNIDLRAVTVTNNGAGLPGRAIYHIRCLLDELGEAQIPVADNDALGPEVFPADIRAADEAVLDDLFLGCTESTLPSATPAHELLIDTVAASSQPVTIVTTGPVTNIAAALSVGGDAFASKVDRIFSMAGAVYVAGNAPDDVLQDGTQELNAFGDAAALQAELAGFSGVHLIPLDATNYVPVTASFSAQVEANPTTPEAKYVAALLSNPLVELGVQANLGFYFWDPLDGVASQTDDVVTYQELSIAVTQSGTETGRTQAVAVGGSPVEVGVFADQTKFQTDFLNTLNGIR